MARYIEEENLIEEIMSLRITVGWKDVFLEVVKESVLRIIKEQPAADVVEAKQIKAVRNDLKWWLETNTEKGVCYIPEHIIEKMIAKMDG